MNMCPICNNNNTELLYEKKYSSPYLYMGRVITLFFYCCPNCGFIYLQNPISAEELKNFYKNLGHISAPNTKYNIQANERQTDFIFSAILRSEIQTILDVGCSDFSFLKCFNEKIEKYGIDVRKETEELTDPSIKYFSGYFEEFESNTKFDLICMRHVLEHFRDINRIFKKLNDLISKEGYLYIEVPDIYYYPHVKASNCGFYFEHISYFSIVSLTNLLTKYDYKLLKIVQEVNPKESKQPYGIIRVLAQNSWTMKKLPLMNDYFLSKRIIELYLDNINKCNLNIVAKISEAIDAGRVAIFGAGGNCVEILNNLNEEKRKEIIIYIDNDQKKIGKKFFGKEIMQLSDIVEFDINIIIVLAYAFDKGIRKQIKDLYGSKYEIITTDG